MLLAEPLRLYAENLWISPYVFSAFVALKEKGLSFECTELALADVAQDSDYVRRSLTARVPSLQHGGFFVSESSAIAEYLEEAFPTPGFARVLPADVRHRAQARQLMAWLRSDLDILREERATITMFYRLRVPPLSARGQAAAAKLLRVAEQVVPVSGACLFGEWCLADSELAFMLHRLLLNGHDLPAHVLAYAQTQWQRRSVTEFACKARPVSVPSGYWAHAGRAPLEPA